jgi:hypothetical protein
MRTARQELGSPEARPRAGGAAAAPAGGTLSSALHVPTAITDRMPIRLYPASRQFPDRGTALAGPAALLAALLAACGSAAPAATPATSNSTAPNTGTTTPAGSGPSVTQAPVAAESNPPGDIPDTTVYVAYQPANSHVQLKVPEGWSRRDAAGSSTFTSNLNSISVAWMPMAAAPTVQSVRASTVQALMRSTLAFRLQSVQAVTLAGGPAVEVIYQVNSPPNQVTGRQYRLVVERFELSRAGHGVVLSLSSAVGSDNVDPWRIVSESVRWL